jgi:hypothetical protein
VSHQLSGGEPNVRGRWGVWRLYRIFGGAKKSTARTPLPFPGLRLAAAFYDGRLCEGLANSQVRKKEDRPGECTSPSPES